MNMGFGYKVIEDLVIAEFVLIFLIVILTFILKLAEDIKRKKKEREKLRIENYFKQLIASQQEFVAQTFPRKMKKIQILLPMLFEYDKTQNNDAWRKIRASLLQNVLLPLARKKSRSQRWIMRFFACEVFALIYEKKDEEYIVRFTQDRVPLVYLHAITAAIRSGSEMAINIIITRMARVYWLTQSVYLEPFKSASANVRQIVEARLLSSKDPLVRTACYKILLQFPPAAATQVDSKNDLNAENFELRLAALKYITHINPEAAVPLLIAKLQDPHWEVRLVAIHRLGKMKVPAALTQIGDCLNDHEWWVRMSAAEALKSLGDEGEALLKSRAPGLDLIPFDASKHISHTLW